LCDRPSPDGKTPARGIAEEGIASYFLRPLSIPSDPNPEMTARLKRVLLDLTAGRSDPGMFEPDTRTPIASEFPETAAFYQSLGPLTAFDFLERQSAGSISTFRCRALFGSTPWIQSFLLH